MKLLPRLALQPWETHAGGPGVLKPYSTTILPLIAAPWTPHW